MLISNTADYDMNCLITPPRTLFAGVECQYACKNHTGARATQARNYHNTAGFFLSWRDA